MNSIRRVRDFVIYSTAILLLISVFTTVFQVKSTALNNVNLVSDIVRKDPLPPGDTSSTPPPIAIIKKPGEDFTLYRTPHLITNFSTDTGNASLIRFAQKLHELKTGRKRKVRIAYLGDSMIEGDLLTQDLRKLLQQTFGGYGVGFVPITSQVSQFRQTVATRCSDNWQDENFKTGKSRRLFFSGHLFHTDNGSVQLTDQTVANSPATMEKSLLCGYSSKATTVTVNNKNISVKPGKPFNRIPLQQDNRTTIKLSVANDALPLYGISFESPSGVIVDNFSFRGITGIEWATIDSAFLKSIEENNPYDLVILQYGVNLLFRPKDKNFDWYAGMMLPVLKKFKACFTEADFILVSTADRAFRYGTEYRSAIGVDSLVKVQAALAFQSNWSFYNQFATMGGTNSIVDWASRKPSLANKDYVHPNHRGSEVLANYFYNAIMKDYEKYVQSLK